MNDDRLSAAAGLPMAQPAASGFSPERLTRLTKAMQREIDAGRVPGAAMMIMRGGALVYAASLGRQTPDGPAMASNSIFRIYSMTKPIVSVALMMLVEEARLALTDPLAKFIPEFSHPQVGVEIGDQLELRAANAAITLHDLMRHTSGLSYGFTGDSAVQKLYQSAKLFGSGMTSADFAAALAQLPLKSQPGAAWEYSHSTDLIGRVIEIVSGQNLGDFLAQNILAPLGMIDTGFFAAPAALPRLAEAFAVDRDSGAPNLLIPVRKAPHFLSGGGGLVSTLADYARFLTMLRNGGVFGQCRLLGRPTIASMVSDHIPPGIPINHAILLPGHGFGLGFSVRRANGYAPSIGVADEYGWGGLAGTSFFVSPRDDLAAILMIQAPAQRDFFRFLFRHHIYAAME